ncbi:hypothetical protein D1816_08520 [Aquimarina sp. AD10]|uniref:hypothetical protein n=1 Tax=Aquimarina TaxID=290174 RepID=UPI000E4F9922|nr:MULTISPECIES: hypothetical protein [Aquimarina]AXT60390.1 hypothetical protein D1816_08520 [Aquimarina sp. AD10]RKN01175.1 hypothetical protein D7033_04965 [Aquimarina sp. AD10]
MVVQEKVLKDRNRNTVFYDIETSTSVKSLEEIRENTLNSKVSKRFIDKNDFGYLYEVNILKKSQSNNQGFNEMEEYLSRLQKNLLIYTNDTGSITSIPNIGEIRELWEDCKFEFKKEFKNIHDIHNIVERMDNIMKSKRGFLEVFLQSEIGTLLFPGFYSRTLQNDKALLQRKFFQNFFGAYTLPILLETQIIMPDNIKNKLIKVVRTGSIEWQFFEEEEVKSFFREILEDYPYINRFDAFYSELYDINNKHQITNALQLLYVKVGDIYSIDRKTTMILQE